MKFHFAVALLVACLCFQGLTATAATLKGTAKNGSTGKAAAGDEVLLLSLADGMTEIGHGKTDVTGRFSFDVPDTKAPRLLRVIHQGVAYHKMAPPDVKSVDVEVYDTAQKLDAISALVDVQRFRQEGDSLLVSEVITVRNASQPPRTLMQDHSFEIRLPANARLELGMAQAGSAPPLKHTPTAGEKQGQYYFRFPLRPGETRFAVSYRLPYKGEAVIEPTILYPLEHFVVMLPSSINFEAKTVTTFRSMAAKADAKVEATAALIPGQSPAFRLWGTSASTGLQSSEQLSGNPMARPGGGLGAPIDLPDPLHNYRWLILGGFAMAMTVGGLYTIRRPTATRIRKSRKLSQHDFIPTTQGS